MIALHLRDSTAHLIAPSQPCSPGLLQASADHPFTAALPCALRMPLLIISATSIGQVLFICILVHNTVKGE